METQLISDKIKVLHDKLSNRSNYYSKNGKGFNHSKARNGIAVKELSNLSVEEFKILLNFDDVRDTILSIDNTDILRTIFRKVPSFFQEIMFSNKRVQDLLLCPGKNYMSDSLDENYKSLDSSSTKIVKTFDYDSLSHVTKKIVERVFSDDEYRQLEIFFNSIKSNKILDMLVDSKYFQRILMLCCDSNKTINFSIIKIIDIERLYANIVNDKDIFEVSNVRKEKINYFFNCHSNNLLLPDGCLNYCNHLSFAQTKNGISGEIVIDDETLSMMPIPMIHSFLSLNLSNKEHINNYLLASIKKDIIDKNYNYDILLESFSKGYSSPLEFIYLDFILKDIAKNPSLKNNFLNFLYKVFCNDEIVEDINLDLVKEILFQKLRDKEINEKNLSNLASYYFTNKLFRTFLFIKFGSATLSMKFFSGISLKQFALINAKHVNMIVKSLKENPLYAGITDIGKLYSCAIILYLVFGLERSLSIISDNKLKSDSEFFEMVYSLDVSKVEFKKEGKKYLPVLSKEFLNFMFANKENNHFLEMIRKETPDALKLYHNWVYLYNNFDDIKDKCNGTITLKKLGLLFRIYNNAEDFSPDNYRLNENNISNYIRLGNKVTTFDRIFKCVIDIYDKMKVRIESSIPYVEGKAQNGYYYRMMRFNDPIIFSIGYRTNCCYRVLDYATKHIEHAALCRNGRILLLYNDKDEFVGFSHLKRNGEVLIANSVECINKTKDERTIEAFSSAIKDIVSITENNPEDKEPISLVCIGSKAYAKPDGREFPSNIKTPTIYEKDDGNYMFTDEYHINLDIIYQKDGLDLNNLKYGNPEVSYMDPRPKICSCNFRNSRAEDRKEALKVIDSIRYIHNGLGNTFIPCYEYSIISCIYNEDWYVLIATDGYIYGDYLDYDDRIKKEFDIALEKMYNEFGKTNGDELKRVRRFKCKEDL